MSFNIWRTDPGASPDDNVDKPLENHNNITGSLEKKYTLNYSIYNTIKKYQGIVVGAAIQPFAWLANKMHGSQTNVHKKTQ